MHNMKVGDKIIIGDIEYTIWAIDGIYYHLIDDDGNGICCEQNFINN